MNERYGSRFERDDRERRAMRDSRDPRYGAESNRYRSDDDNDDRFQSQVGSRHSYNRDNEYQFDENRGRGHYGGGEQGRREWRNDDFYSRGGQGDWSSRSYPQQSSFDRSGYDSDREFWEGQRAGYGHQQGRYGGQRSDYGGGYGDRQFGGRGSGAAGGQSSLYGRQNYGTSSGNYWEHGGEGGAYGSGRHHEFGQGGRHHDFGQGQGGGNYWEHGGGTGFQPGQRGQQFGTSAGNYSEHGGYGEHGGHYGGGSMTGMRNRPPKGYTRSDERLKEDICEQLMHTPGIDAGDVGIEVKEGKVVLDGTVPERFMKHRIEDIAEECSGVKDVDNRIRVSRDGSEDGGSSRSSGHGAAGGTSTGTHASTHKSK